MQALIMIWKLNICSSKCFYNLPEQGVAGNKQRQLAISIVDKQHQGERLDLRHRNVTIT